MFTQPHSLFTLCIQYSHAVYTYVVYASLLAEQQKTTSLKANYAIYLYSSQEPVEHG